MRYNLHWWMQCLLEWSKQRSGGEGRNSRGMQGATTSLMTLITVTWGAAVKISTYKCKNGTDVPKI